MDPYGSSCSTSQSTLPVPFVPIYNLVTLHPICSPLCLPQCTSRTYTLTTTQDLYLTSPSKRHLLTPREPTVEPSAHKTPSSTKGLHTIGARYGIPALEHRSAYKARNIIHHTKSAAFSITHDLEELLQTARERRDIL